MNGRYFRHVLKAGDQVRIQYPYMPEHRKTLLPLVKQHKYKASNYPTFSQQSYTVIKTDPRRDLVYLEGDDYAYKRGQVLYEPEGVVK